MREASLLPRLAAVCLVSVGVLTGCGSEGAAPGASSPSSSTDGMSAVAACLTQRGWQATFDPTDQSVEVKGVPDAQRSAYARDNKQCMAQAGQDGPAAPLTDDQLHVVYEHEVATAQCLRELGVTVPQASSEQAFKDAYASGSAFSAYASVGNVDQETWQQFNEKCPQQPEGF